MTLASTKQGYVVSFAASMAGLVHKWKEFLGQSQTMTSCPITITNQNLIMLKSNLLAKKDKQMIFSQEKNLKDEFEYIVESREIGRLYVAELDKYLDQYLDHHRLPKKGKKPDKIRIIVDICR